MPEKTLLHRIVREHMATFLVEVVERDPSSELSRFIRAEFERDLRCGLLCAAALPASAVSGATITCSWPSPASAPGRPELLW